MNYVWLISNSAVLPPHLKKQAIPLVYNSDYISHDDNIASMCVLTGATVRKNKFYIYTNTVLSNPTFVLNLNIRSGSHRYVYVTTDYKQLFSVLDELDCNSEIVNNVFNRIAHRDVKAQFEQYLTPTGKIR